MSRALAPMAAALLGLAGSLGATLAMYAAASAALDRVLEERLRGAGETAARLLECVAATNDVSRALDDFQPPPDTVTYTSKMPTFSTSSNG